MDYRPTLVEAHAFYYHQQFSLPTIISNFRLLLSSAIFATYFRTEWKK
jgi:hypothetical protein